MVSESQDERQTPAFGDDLASPRRPGLLHLHDEPCSGHGEPALPLSITPAATLLLTPGRRSWISTCSRTFLKPPALPRQFQDAVSPLPEAGASVRFQTPVPLPGSDPLPRSWREPLFLPGLSLQPVQWHLTQTIRLGLHVLPNKQD